MQPSFNRKDRFPPRKGKINEKIICLDRSSGAGKSIGIVYSAEEAGEPMTKNYL